MGKNNKKEQKVVPLLDRILVKPIRGDELKSKAGILLTTEVAIAEEPKKKAPPAPDMGGMEY